MTGRTEGSAVLYVRVPLDVKAAVDLFAEQNGMTITRAVTELLRAAINGPDLETRLDRLEAAVFRSAR